ncbi:MAG TPA: hypothetical protein PKE45_01875 [Caldilineaceae bacterium]|nr:hypothetical protein [Caldilineaceae bacterium]
MNTDAMPLARQEQSTRAPLLVNDRVRSTYVPALAGEVLPPVQAIPSVHDPYAPYAPQVQQIVKVDVTPFSRAQAMVMKASAVTVALAVFTLAALVMLDSFYFFLWLALASLEWVGTFITLAAIDYRETPSAQSRMHLSRYLDMMEREQIARLRAMYGREAVDA